MGSNPGAEASASTAPLRGSSSTTEPPLARVSLTAAASVVVGAVVGRSSDKPALPAALRQLAIVVAASAVTYGIGNAFGTAVG